MDNNDTFRVRLLQDKALRRRVYHQCDIVFPPPHWGGIADPDAHRKKKGKKDRQKERQLWNDRSTRNCLSLPSTVSLFVSPSPSASQSFALYVLRSRGRWRSAGRSSAARGVIVHQSPSARPPAARRSVGWSSRRRRWRGVPRGPLPRSARWRRSSCRTQRLPRPHVWRMRSSRWCWAEDSAVGRTRGRPTPGRRRRRAPAGRRADLWPGGRCGRAPCCRKVGWAGRGSGRDSGRRSVRGRPQCLLEEGEWAGQGSAPAGRSVDSAVGSRPPG